MCSARALVVADCVFRVVVDHSVVVEDTLHGLFQPPLQETHVRARRDGIARGGEQRANPRAGGAVVHGRRLPGRGRLEHGGGFRERDQSANPRQRRVRVPVPVPVPVPAVSIPILSVPAVSVLSVPIDRVVRVAGASIEAIDGGRVGTPRDGGASRGGDCGVHARDERVHARVIRRAAISAASDATRGALGCGEGIARRGRGWRIRVRVRAESGEARRKARRPSGLGNLGIVGGRQLRLGRIEDQTHLARARRAVEGEDGRERVARKITRGARERMREEGGGAFRTDARLVGARRVVSFRGDAFGREAANNRRVGRRVVGRRTHERYRRDRVRCGVGAPVRARECRRAHPAPRRARAL